MLLELQSRVRNESAGSEALRGQIHILEQQMARLQAAQDALVEKAQQPVEVSHELAWLGENMEQLAALLQSAQAHSQADVQPELPPETAELLQRLEAANREIHHLNNETSSFVRKLKNPSQPFLENDQGLSLSGTAVPFAETVWFRAAL
ncbi:hypothetical protein UA44_00365 [Klebsiella aerogenes]|nr:hypothetical protein UA44_00365 [Klebsiella aerogenes]